MWEKRKLNYNSEFISGEFVIRAGAHGQSHTCRHGFGEAEPGDSSTGSPGQLAAGPALGFVVAIYVIVKVNSLMFSFFYFIVVSLFSLKGCYKVKENIIFCI